MSARPEVVFFLHIEGVGEQGIHEHSIRVPSVFAGPGKRTTWRKSRRSPARRPVCVNAWSNCAMRGVTG